MRILAAVLISLCAACGRDAYSPPPLPEPGGGPPADTLLLQRYFASVQLQDAVTGQAGLPDPEKGLRFSRKARLQVLALALRPGQALWTVDSRATGRVVWQFQHAFAAGENRVDIGRLEADLYRLQLRVDGGLALSLVFAAE